MAKFTINFRPLEKHNCVVSPVSWERAVEVAKSYMSVYCVDCVPIWDEQQQTIVGVVTDDANGIQARPLF